MGKALWTLCHAHACSFMAEVMRRAQMGDFGGQSRGEFLCLVIRGGLSREGPEYVT